MTVTESRIALPTIVLSADNLATRHCEHVHRRTPSHEPVVPLCTSAWERRARQRLQAWEQRDEQWADVRARHLAAVARRVEAETASGRRLSLLVGGLGGLLALLGVFMCLRRLLLVGFTSELAVWGLVLLGGMVVAAACSAQARMVLRIREAKIADRLGCSQEDFLTLDWAEPVARARHARLRHLVDFDAEPHGVATTVPMSVRDPRRLPEGPLRELAREWASFSR